MAIPMSLKQRIALAIKRKQQTDEQKMPTSDPKFGTLQASSGTKGPITSPTTTDNPKLDKPLFGQSEKAFNNPFLKLKKKFTKF